MSLGIDFLNRSGRGKIPGSKGETGLDPVVGVEKTGRIWGGWSGDSEGVTGEILGRSGGWFRDEGAGGFWGCAGWFEGRVDRWFYGRFSGIRPTAFFRAEGDSFARGMKGKWDAV